MIEEFIWGTKNRLVQTDALIVDLLTIFPRGYSSVHKHKHQRNIFHWLNGELTIRHFTQGISGFKVLDTFSLRGYPCSKIIIPEEKLHQFYNPSKTKTAQVLEVVFSYPIGLEDIVRYTERGCGDLIP